MLSTYERMDADGTFSISLMFQTDRAHWETLQESNLMKTLTEYLERADDGVPPDILKIVLDRLCLSSTAELVERLKQRDGVTLVNVSSGCKSNLTVDGAASVLIVKEE